MRKGSAEAITWGKKMQRIRHAGLKTEKKFFGPRGIFAKAGHVKHLQSSSRNPNAKGWYLGVLESGRLESKYVKSAVSQPWVRAVGPFASNEALADYVETHLGKDPRIVRGLIESFLQKNSHECQSWEQPSWKMIVDYLKSEGWKPMGKKGVAAFSRLTGDLFQVLQLEARAWRVLWKNSLNSSMLSLGTWKQLDVAMISANRQANDYVRDKGKRNPITMIGNPPQETCFRVSLAGGRWKRFDRLEDAKALAEKIYQKTGVFTTIEHVKKNPGKTIQANVSGVMYNKVHEVQAEKTGNHEHKGFWYHPFKGKSNVEMLALDSGDILLHSKGGKKLWRKA